MSRKQIVTSLGIPKDIKDFIDDKNLNLAKLVRIEAGKIIDNYDPDEDQILDKYRGR